MCPLQHAMPRYAIVVLRLALCASLAGAGLCDTGGQESCIQQSNRCPSEQGRIGHGLSDEHVGVQNAISELRELLNNARDAEAALTLAIARHSTLLQALENTSTTAEEACSEKDEQWDSETPMQQPHIGMANLPHIQYMLHA